MYFAQEEALRKEVGSSLAKINSKLNGTMYSTLETQPLTKTLLETEIKNISNRWNPSKIESIFRDSKSYLYFGIEWKLYSTSNLELIMITMEH